MDAVKFIEERNRMCGTMSEAWGVRCLFELRKWNKRFSELYDELKGDVERWND